LHSKALKSGLIREEENAQALSVHTIAGVCFDNSQCIYGLDIATIFPRAKGACLKMGQQNVADHVLFAPGSAMFSARSSGNDRA
jgi:hypothetical protein